MSLQFIVGPSGSGKTKLMQEMVLKRAMENPDMNMLVLVPEQFNMSTAREIVDRSPQKGIINIDVLSFNRLAHRIFDEAGGNRRKLLDDVGKSMILRHLSLLHENELTVLNGKMGKAGYINEVKSVISEFMQYQITPAVLSDIISNNNTRPNLTKKLSDLNKLYNWFVDFMGQKYITGEELLEAAAAMADKAQVLNNAEIYLDGYTGFTPVQYSFIQVLMKSCTVVVNVTLGREMYTDGILDYQSKAAETDLFAMGQNTINKLYGIAKKTGVVIKEPITIMEPVSYRLRGNNALSYLEQVLFRPKLGSTARLLEACETQEAREGLSIWQASGPDREAAFVCRRIHELVRNEGYRYSDIAILTGSMEEYNYLLKNEMAHYNIPFFEDARHKGAMNPLSELIEALVELGRKSFSYESVFRILRCGLLDISKSEVDMLDNYVQAAGIRKKSEYFKPFTKTTRYTDEEALGQLNVIREGFERIFSGISEKFPPKKKVKCINLLTALYEFLADNQIDEKLGKMAEAFRESGDLSSAQEYEGIYKYLMDFMDICASFLGDEMVTLKEFGEIMEAGIGEMSLGILPPATDQVLVGDVKRSRLSEIKILFVMGVNDGLIPGDERKRGILSEADRQLLKDQNIELSPDTREQAFVQRFYLYMYLTKASDQLYLSYSQISPSGDSRRPSYLIGELLSIFKAMKVENAEEYLSAAAPLVAWEGLRKLSGQLRSWNGDEQLLGSLAENEGYRKILNSMYEHACRKYKEDPLKRAVALALYGAHIKGSVTRLEQFAKCAYAHFMKYGLKLQEKEEYSFKVMDIGNLYHSAIEKFGIAIKEQGESWLSIEPDKAESIMDQVLTLCFQEIADSSLYNSSRNLYIENHMKRVLRRTARVLTYQLQRGDFEPVAYELSFGSKGELKGRYYKLDEETSMTLEGKIDRVDCLEKEDRVLVKVVDYKSGDKDLNLAMVYQGISLQLIVYMDTANDAIRTWMKQKKIENAGVLYYHVDDPLVDRDYRDGEADFDKVESKVRENLRQKGYVNSDIDIIQSMDKNIDKKSDVIPVTLNKDGSLSKSSRALSQQEFHNITGFVNEKVQELSKEILSGRISVWPYKTGSGENMQTGCDYCEYRNICGFDSKLPGYCYHDIDKISDDMLSEMGIEKE